MYKMLHKLHLFYLFFVNRIDIITNVMSSPIDKFVDLF